MYKWHYYGPVKEFDKLVAENWYGETVAATADKARTNLAYQYKKQHGKSARSKIILPGIVEKMN